jgi:hypothetical protein
MSRVYALLAAGLLARGRKAGGRVVGAESAPGTVADDLQKLLDVACIVVLWCLTNSSG